MAEWAAAAGSESVTVHLGLTPGCSTAADAHQRMATPASRRRLRRLVATLQTAPRTGRACAAPVAAASSGAPATGTPEHSVVRVEVTEPSTALAAG